MFRALWIFPRRRHLITETAKPATSTQQTENDRTWVTEWRFQPGESTGWHRQELDGVVIPMSWGRLASIESSGERVEIDLKAGVAMTFETGWEHDVLFDGPGEFVFVEVELK